MHFIPKEPIFYDGYDKNIRFINSKELYESLNFILSLVRFIC